MAPIDELGGTVQKLLSDSYDLSNVELEGKRVLLRADLNVPTSGGKVQDLTRVHGVLPTVRLLMQKQARVIIASHLGRPEPSKQSWEQLKAKYSLAPVAAELEALLGPDTFVGLADDCVGPAAEEMVARVGAGQVCLLENTRFHAEDVANDDGFSQGLAKLADVVVNDAFGVVHRDQASVTVRIRPTLPTL